MPLTPFISGAALLGIFSGLALAGLTPTDPLPTKQPEWRGRAASLRAETEALYVWSLPEDLSPTTGYGNPAYRQAAVEVRYDPYWRVSPPLPAHPTVRVEEVPPMQTGNEATIAELEALNESFEPGAQEPPTRAAEAAEPEADPLTDG